MDTKRLILLEPKNLLLKPAKEDTPKAIANRMCEGNPTLAKLGVERVAAMVFPPNSDFCAYSSSQAQKKMLGGNTPTPVQPDVWDNLVAAYIKATSESTLNTALVDLLTDIKDQTNGSILLGILANAYWFSTPILKAALPKGLFDLFLQSGDLRCRKPWPQLYELTESITSLYGENILLLDTDYESVLEARRHGWMAELATADMDPALVGTILDWFMLAEPAEQQGEPTADVVAPEPHPQQPKKLTETTPVAPVEPTPVPAPITLGTRPTDKPTAPENGPESHKDKP